MLEQLDLICGDMSPNVARLFARLPVPDRSGVWQLAGSVRGPESRYAETLPATLRLRDLGPGKTLLAAATIPDPCYWSPEYPLLYRIRVELLDGRQVVQREEFTTGLRRLGTSGRDLVLESKRWVLRGGHAESADTDELDAWHETEVAQLVAGVDSTRCSQASERGVLLVVELDASGDELISQLRQLARWPAAAIVVLRGAVAPDVVPAEAAPNVLFAQPFAAGEPPQPAPWCQIALCQVGTPREFAAHTAHLTVPVVAVRPLAATAPLSQLRAACDHLQRDLAPFGDFAGYLV